MSRCIVTGHRAGRAVFVSDGPPAQVVSLSTVADMEVAKVWANTTSPVVGDGAAVHALTDIHFLPKAGESRFYILTFPPDSVMTAPGFDLVAMAREFAELNPEIAAVKEEADPAMHRTDTIDHIVILDGEVWLELDDQEQKLLRQHDVLIQCGTRHAWRNRSDKPVRIAVFMVGAERQV